VSAQTQTPVKRLTPPDIRARKNGDPIVSLTAYDAPMAALMDPHVDLILVGDSVGMVVHGLPNTIPVTLDMMILHGQAVMRGSQKALVVIDMPFGSYERSKEQAFENCVRVLQETGAGAVKLETSVAMAETVRYLVDRGIPVQAHVGLRPQAALADGGFKAKGRDADSRARVLQEAQAMDEAGAFCMVVEGVAEDVAREVTEMVSIPTIGIGASVACDGQVLVMQDMLGVFDWTPKFVKKFADMRTQADAAFKAYADAVRDRSFPGAEHVYSAKKR